MTTLYTTETLSLYNNSKGEISRENENYIYLTLPGTFHTKVAMLPFMCMLACQFPSNSILSFSSECEAGNWLTEPPVKQVRVTDPKCELVNNSSFVGSFREKLIFSVLKSPKRLQCSSQERKITLMWTAVFYETGHHASSSHIQSCSDLTSTLCPRNLKAEKSGMTKHKHPKHSVQVSHEVRKQEGLCRDQVFWAPQSSCVFFPCKWDDSWSHTFESLLV